MKPTEPLYNFGKFLPTIDCGCDNCHANSPSYPAYVTNPFLDITDRVDSVYKMQEWAGKTNYKKPVSDIGLTYARLKSFR